MSDSIKKHPPILGLFQKRIDGDDSLLELARLVFEEAGLGAEFYADTAEELEWLMGFRPSADAPVMVHLNRGIDLLDEEGMNTVFDFAEQFCGRLAGMVVHDQKEVPVRFDEYIASLNNINGKLKGLNKAPFLFIEYAAGLEPELFIKLFREIGDLEHVSVCIDISHLGLWHAGNSFLLNHPGESIDALKTDERQLGTMIDDLDHAVRSALPKVIDMITTLGGLGKPMHFHLHDSHPLSTINPIGISDHISFLSSIEIPFEYRGKRFLDPLFGPEGLKRIVSEALRSPGPDLVSFTLEIHQEDRRLDLGERAYLFDHWRDRTNAEKMNHWLSVLKENQQLLIDACG